MSDERTYASWRALSAAIKEAATKRAQQEENADISSQLKIAHFDRLLSRVFSEGERSEWLLKGGSSMLARIPESRATKDLDLVSTSHDLDDAQEALEDLASIDLGDHVQFVLVDAKNTGGGANQPEAEARRLVFEMQDADTGRKIDQVPVDLVVEQPPVGTVEVVEPAHRLHLPRHVSSTEYRLFPITDQIADKVCATLQGYGEGRPSTREKDLVDLVVISNYERFELTELQDALEAERLHRRMEPMTSFEVPTSWGPQFKKLASRTPACHGIVDVDEALSRVKPMVEPGFTSTPDYEEATWLPERGWTPLE